MIYDEMKNLRVVVQQKHLPGSDTDGSLWFYLRRLFEDHGYWQCEYCQEWYYETKDEDNWDTRITGCCSRECTAKFANMHENG